MENNNDLLNNQSSAQPAGPIVQSVQSQVQPVETQPVQPQPQPVVAQPEMQQPQFQQQYQQQYQQPYQQYQQPYQQPYPQPYPQQYQQVQQGYMDPQYAANQKLTATDLMTPEELSDRRKKATIFCIISLALHFIPGFISGTLTSIVENITETSSNFNSAEPVSLLISILFGGSYIASWVLMIIARVKYKESKFAKVLMWVYIGILAAGILAVVLIIAMCAYMLKDCQGF
ncbi:MAG: hypothetical protein IKG30_11460 [Clostridiales bacterium]|nr:hypothetical protein [Clostridiales bacterium]